MRSQTPRLCTYLAVAAYSLTLVGCPRNPATGERQLILISQGQEIELGQQGAEQVRASIGLYQSDELQDYVSDIGLGMAARTERPELPWSFQVVDDPVVNAFALPGGPIFLTRGILGYFNSEAELAAVIGHEIGHVTARHSAEQISRAQFAQLGLGLGSIFVPEVAQFQDVLGAGLGLLFLKFGRDDERQADDLGFRYMLRLDYDPREMVDVFDMLSRVSEGSGSGLPSWLSTHPDPGERAERMRERLRTTSLPPGASVARQRYLQRIEGLVFGENPRNGFFQNEIFSHPDLEFRLAFPADWRTQNMAQAVAAISPDEDAILHLTLEPEAASEDAAARAFLSQEGIQASRTFSDPVNGLPASWGYFSARTESGVVEGLAVFLSYGGRIYRILGYTSSARMSAYDGTFRATMMSFERLDDPAALDVQPKRVELVTLKDALTFQEFTTRYPSTIDDRTLAVINAVQEDATLPAGRTMKRVTGGKLPGN